MAKKFRLSDSNCIRIRNWSHNSTPIGKSKMIKGVSGQKIKPNRANIIRISIAIKPPKITDTLIVKPTNLETVLSITALDISDTDFP